MIGKAILTGLAAVALAAGAQAQGWQNRTTDERGWFIGQVFHPGKKIAFRCSGYDARDPGADPMYGEGTSGDAAYLLTVEVADELVRPLWPDHRDYFVSGLGVSAGDQGFRLPVVYLNELYSGNWEAPLWVSDGLVQAMLQGGPVRIIAPDGKVLAEVPGDGLPLALAGIIRFCDSHWASQSHPVPAHATAIIQALRPQDGAQRPALPGQPGGVTEADWIPLRKRQPEDGPTITFVPPVLPARPGQTMDIRAIQTAHQACGGTSNFREGSLWPGDYDGDGQQDVVMNWGFVDCIGQNGLATGVHGACDTSGLCRITVFSSAQIAAGLADWSPAAYHAEFDGIGPGPLFMNTREAFCGTASGEFGCTASLRWIGRGFALAHATPLAVNPSGAAQLVRTPPSAEGLPAGLTLAPDMGLPDTPPAAPEQHIAKLCQGLWVLSDFSVVSSSDVDGDGQPDYMLDWTGVQCDGGMKGRAFCGASNCRIDVFLSSRGYANPVEFLGVAPRYVQNAQGKVGVLISGSAFVCADGYCDRPFYWNGQTLAQ